MPAYPRTDVQDMLKRRTAYMKFCAWGWRQPSYSSLSVVRRAHYTRPHVLLSIPGYLHDILDACP